MNSKVNKHAQCFELKQRNCMSNILTKTMQDDCREDPRKATIAIQKENKHKFKIIFYM